MTDRAFHSLHMKCINQNLRCFVFRTIIYYYNFI